MKTLLITLSLIAITPVQAQNYQAPIHNLSPAVVNSPANTPKPQKKGNLASKLKNAAKKTLQLPFKILGNLASSYPVYNDYGYGYQEVEEASNPTPSYMPQTYMLSGPTGQMQTVNYMPTPMGGFINYGPVMGLR